MSFKTTNTDSSTKLIRERQTHNYRVLAVQGCQEGQVKVQAQQEEMLEEKEEESVYVWELTVCYVCIIESVQINLTPVP